MNINFNDREKLNADLRDDDTKSSFTGGGIRDKKGKINDIVSRLVGNQSIIIIDNTNAECARYLDGTLVVYFVNTQLECNRIFFFIRLEIHQRINQSESVRE
jgi:hypothetical protein